MKFLFFDIECSNCFGGIGKMCEFGYVLTDDKFNILKMNDIPMSPGKSRDCRFHLQGRKKKDNIELAYNEEYYYECKEFPSFYEKINGLFSDSETICFAFSASNDIMHLYNSCKRYGLKIFQYNCYDVQKISDRYLKSENSVNLKHTHIELVGSQKTVKYQEHLSRDDARMTADILEAICSSKNKTPDQLLKECEFAKIDSNEFIKTWINKQKAKENRTKAHNLYKNEASRNLKNQDLEEHKGKRYNVSGKLKSEPDLLKSLIDQIKASGKIVVDDIRKTDVFVAMNEEDKSRLMKNISELYDGEYVLADELLNVKNEK